MHDVPVLLYGCGPLASLFVGAVQSTPGANLRVVGIVDDAGTPRGRSVHHVPVLGGPQDLDRIIADLAVQGIHPQRLVLTRTADGLSPEALLFAEHCRARHGVELHFLPDLLGLPAGAVASAAARAPAARERAYIRARRPVELALSALALLVRKPGLLLRSRTLRKVSFGQELDRLELDPARPDETGRQRLLVVNRFFHPDTSATSQLLTDLVDALDRRGFAVTVLTGRHGYLNTGAVLPAREWRGGVEVRRLRHTGFGRFSLPGRTLDGATFAAGAFLALLTRARPGDVILAKTDPPLISVLAWLAARLTGARLVNWCQDLFPETAAALGLPCARGPLGTTLRALRNASLRGAEMNVALCPGMAARLAAERVPRERLTVIPNWADGELIRPQAPQDNPLRAAWGLGERFVIGYSGNLGCAHAVDPLVELMTLLEDAPGLVFLFIGAGSGYRALRTAIAGRRVENVVFRPYQDRTRLPLTLTAPDVHLVTLRPEWEGLVMPSKLYGALAAGRPVVFIGDPEGDVARIVRAGPGLVARPDRMPALAAKIRALRRDPARLARMGAAARRAYEACPRDASLDAWTRCLRAVARPAAARPLPQPVPAE
jgi:colanic acid biosynthesis glycosyl transferase WcaI